jgi:hypothetical protein
MARVAGHGGWRIAGWGAAAGVLAAPLIGMLVTDEVAWGPGDFLLAAGLLLGAGAAVELALRRSPDRAWRAGVATALAGGVLLIWANLAVGLIGEEGGAVNVAVLAVPAIGLVGAVLARLRPAGIALAMAATLLAHAALCAVAALAGAGPAGLLPLVLALPWAASAWLFRRAARQEDSLPRT